MTGLSFDLLYGEDKVLAWNLFLLWSNDFLEGFAGPDCRINTEKAMELVENLRDDDFPADGGFHNSSPFKKAANIYVWLHALNPFETSLSSEYVPKILASHKHTITSLIGFSIVQTCLHGARLKRCDEKEIELSNPINISKHFFSDLVEASQGICPVHHFKIFSLLFESLAYEANPEASYAKVFV
jgi:hypothetical protein